MPAHATDRGRRTSGPQMALRLLVITTRLVFEAARTLPAAGARLFRSRESAKRRLYQGLVHAVQALGPTFVKFGQIAGARRDALPAHLCDALGTLHDRVTPMPWPAAERVLDEARRRRPALAVREVDPRPVGSGSIACVYRAVLTDGRVVALKLKRPGIDRRMRTDLALLRGFVRLAERTPAMRGMPMGDLVSYVNEAILGQLDFAREAENLAVLRDSVAGL
ncbi:AarF/UbiB family protein, partial [Salinispora sp. H7-4]|uniref:AarF/UbiB family protein n=1 Tax=Salinispora sp. H7-4 TaxID=2748321 RepID=UPI0015D27D44